MSPGPAEVPPGSPSRSNGRGRSATRSRPLKLASSTVRGSRLAVSCCRPLIEGPGQLGAVDGELDPHSLLALLGAVLLIGGVVGVLRQRAVDLVGDWLQPFVADV